MIESLPQEDWKVRVDENGIRVLSRMKGSHLNSKVPLLKTTFTFDPKIRLQDILDSVSPLSLALQRTVSKEVG